MLRVENMPGKTYSKAKRSLLILDIEASSSKLVTVLLLALFQQRSLLY
jgi:hypothetical protein